MFDNPIMLAGLGGAAVPLVIHLIGRARYRTVDWGAMMFLESAVPRYRDASKLRELVLLGIRMAAVALLAIALARPVMGRAESSVAESRVAVAIVVDCSGSMAYEDVAGARMDRARTAVLQIQSTLKRGDRACLIAVGADLGPVPALTGDLQSVAARAADLKPTPGSADLASTIASAGELLRRQQGVTRQLFVVCDRQAGNWGGVDESFISNWRGKGELSRFVVIPVGGRETDNLATASISLINPPAVRGCPAELEIKVRNYGSSSRAGVPLMVRVGGHEILTTTLSLKGHETSIINVPVTFPSDGAQLVSAELRGGGPGLDDRRDFIVEVSMPPRVLLVQGGQDYAAARMVQASLAPYATAGREGADAAALDVVSADEWDESEIDQYQCIILDDVSGLAKEQAAALQQFVYGGGGLLLAPGMDVRTNDYNRMLYRKEGGLLPAMLHPAVAATRQSIEVASIDTSHPLTHFLAGHLAGRLAGSSAEVMRYLPTTGYTPTAHVLARLTSGEAFMIEHPYGRGRVALVTCTLRPESSMLPLTNLYLPLMQSALRYLIGANVPQRNVSAGEALMAVFEPPVDAAGGVVVRPDGSRDACDIVAADGRSEMRYTRTTMPGLYQLRAGAGPGERVALFTVAPPESESDLSPLDEPQWQRLASALGFERIEMDDRPLMAKLSATRGGGDYWLAALAGVLALMVIELAMTRAWGRSGMGMAAEAQT